MSMHRNRLARVTGLGALAVLGGMLAGCSLIGTLVGGGADVFALAVGDCFNDPGTDDVSTVEAVDCAEQHDNEVYYSHTLEGDAFPGEEAIFAEAEDVCLSRFEEFANVSYDESMLDYSYLYPSEQSWAEGDREVLCLIYALDDEWMPIPVEGTLRNAGR